MRNLKTEGIIIKRRNFGEADRILTVFTKDHGKLQLKAKGVRRITSRRSSHTELLNLTSLYLYQGRNMYLLTEAIVVENFSQLKNDLLSVGFAYHICELIDGLCPENQENQKVFDLLKQTLFALKNDKNLENIVEIIHDFEVNLLILLGFWKVSDRIPAKIVNTHSIIENLLERKLKSKQILQLLK